MDNLLPTPKHPDEIISTRGLRVDLSNSSSCCQNYSSYCNSTARNALFILRSTQSSSHSHLLFPVLFIWTFPRWEKGVWFIAGRCFILGPEGVSPATDSYRRCKQDTQWPRQIRSISVATRENPKTSFPARILLRLPSQMPICHVRRQEMGGANLCKGEKYPFLKSWIEWIFIWEILC